MSENCSSNNSSMQQTAARLAEAKSLVICTHDRPDGDAIGSILALAAAARAAGKTAHVVLADPLPRRYAFLAEGEELHPGAEFPHLAAASDCAVIVDTCTVQQLRGLGPQLDSIRAKLVVIDHHQTWEDIAAIRWSDPSAAAAGVLLVELLDLLKWPLTKPVATALLTAITADTGWLQYANTDARALRAAALCQQAGVAVDELYQTLFQNDRPQRLALLGRMLSGMELHANGRAAVMTLSRRDFAETGAGYDETENLVNEAMRIGSVAVALVLVEQEKEIRGSLRSKRPPAPR